MPASCCVRSFSRSNAASTRSCWDCEKPGEVTAMLGAEYEEEAADEALPDRPLLVYETVEARPRAAASRFFSSCCCCCCCCCWVGLFCSEK